MTGRPLRILHLNTERGWRGGERQTFLIAQGLARAGHLSLVVARPGQPLSERSIEAGLETIPCSARSELDLAAARWLKRCVLAREVDVIHAHTAHAVALAALATRRTPVRTVITRRTEFGVRSNLFSRWKYRRADAIIAVSESVKRSLAAGGLDASRIEVIPDGVPLGRQVVAASREALGIPRDAPLAIMVGALTGEKDPSTFVRAVAVAHERVPALRALLVGSGPLREQLQHEVERLGIGDVLTLTGQRDDPDELMTAADVVVLSSTREGLGSVLLDAMAFGKPVAATAAGGIAETVVHDETGLLVAPGDSEALGDAIARIAGGRGLAGRLAAGALARAPRYSIDEVVSRTTAVYERVLSASRSRGAR